MNGFRSALAALTSTVLFASAAGGSGSAAATVPRHVLTGMHELCYEAPCYHAPQAVPLREVARWLSWAYADKRVAEAARKLGIRTYAYVDPSIQYDPKRDFAPLYGEDEATFLHACDGGRAAVKRGDLDGALMDQAAPAYRAKVRAYVDREIRGRYDALFVDDVFAAYHTYATVTRPPCEQSWEREREATFGLWSQLGMPVIFNGLGDAPDDGRTEPHAQAALDSPHALGGMYEFCLSNRDDRMDHTLRHKRVDGAWRSAQNSHLETVARDRLFLCYAASATPGDTPAGADERAYVYASFLLVYQPQRSVLEMAADSTRSRVPVFPESELVALEPRRPQPREVDALRGEGGAYLREYKRCVLAGKEMGPCAAVVNPSANAPADLGLRRYAHALALHGGALPDGGRADALAPAPARLAPATGTVLFR